MKILFATPEFAPLVKTGGLGDVSAALPAALARQGHDVRVLLPAYAHMQPRGQLTGVWAMPASGAWPAAQILQIEAPGEPVLYLLTCPALYARNGSPYVDARGRDFQDNALRFGLLSRAAALIGMHDALCGWQAEVVHANDWPCGLAPLYLHQARSAGSEAVAASIVTIHNLAFQGVFPMDVCDLWDIPETVRGMEGLEFWGQASMLKAALQYADVITTVSPTYALEIQEPAYGHGLDGVLRAQAGKLHGILNGIDTRIWNPAVDARITERYSAAQLAGKAVNKAALQAHCGLAPQRNRLLFGAVGRLTPQKGVDLIAAGAPAIVQAGGQLVVLGTGDEALEQSLREAAARHPEHVHVHIGFDETLAHQIVAGADAFLMPSRFEPCGLTQMYSQAYGTPPIVAPTGGLLDSVADADEDEGGGFIMAAHTQAAFDDAVARAFATWQAPQRWRAIQLAGMRRDFGWDGPARAYANVCEQAMRDAARMC